MKHADFVHLHNHSQFSLLDGATRIEAMVKRAKEYGMPALALTDHGNLFGAMEFYTKCRAEGIVPIVGCEAYVAPRGMQHKASVSGAPDGGYHLLLLSKNLTGYKNLVKLVSAAYTEGFFYRPRIDFELFKQHAEGLVATSACVQGEVAQNLLAGRTEQAEETARRYLDLLGQENYYLEIQNHKIDIEDQVRPLVIDLAKRLGVNLVATNDCHYLEQKHAKAHDALLCIQTGKVLSDQDRMRYNTDQIYFKSPDEMKKLFGDTPEAIDNTLAIAEMCHLEFEPHKFYLPDFPIPDTFKTKDEYLAHMARKGFATRYPRSTPELETRLNYELSVIASMGFAGYFLVVADLVHYAKNNGVSVGPGRGSAAGSLVSYCLGITDIDPIKFNLLFERFLNPDRISMPDIDIDFSDRGRDQVIQYVINKYGKDNVCQIITFGTMAARAVVRDVGRVLGMSYAEVDRIAKIIPFELDMTLEKALRLKPELKQMAEDDPRVSTLLDYSQTLEGLTRHASTHAAGVVIAPAPLTDFVPLFKGSKGEVTTQYSMKWIESIGLLKMDFLGLRTLTVLEDAEKAVKENRGVTVNWDELGLEDAKVFDLFASGETTGIFQFESSGMRDYLRKLRPSVFEDIIAMNALYRPGALDANMIEKYIDRKYGREKVEYYHPRIEKILRDTYGVIVYQDQVMQVAAELAGFSMAKADTLRSAMGKKNADLMARMKSEFIEGAVSLKVPREVAETVFGFCETFARYGFNRAHSAAYAVLAYRCAWLKTFYPVEFMAALMTSEMGDTDRIRIFMRECRRLSIPVDPPDINVSHSAFTARGERILFGLSAVKNVGEGAVEVIVAARDEGGEFKSIFEFTGRVDVRTVNRRALEALVCAGAFDRLPGHRAQVLTALDAAISYGAQSATDRRRGQASLFDGGLSIETAIPQLPDVPTWTSDERLAKEKEALGFYVSSHPLLAFAEELQLFSTASTDQVADLPDEAEVSIGGVITAMKTQADRKGQMMSFFTLEDFGGTLEVICFAEPFRRCSSILVNDALVLLTGRTNTREGERPKLILNNAVPLSEVRGGAVLDVHARLTPELLAEGVLDQIDDLIGRYDKGNGFLFLYYPVGTETVKIRANRVRLDARRDLVASLRELLGSESVFCTKG